MKKVLSMVLLVILLFISETVFADAGAPSVRNYLVEVTNPAGTYTYEGRMVNDKYEMIMKDKVNFGEKLMASYDMSMNDVHYVEVYRLNESGEMGDYIEGNRYIGWVQLKDINGIKDGLTLEDFDISDQPKELTVLNSDGVKMYEWPAYSYNEIGIIPYKKIVQGYGSSANEGWYYINNNGVHGFICALDGDVGWKGSSNYSLMTMFKNIVLTDVNGNKVGELPKNTIINNYYDTDYRLWKKYVFYGEKGGFVKSDEIAYDVSSSQYLNENRKYTINYDGAVLIGVDNSITEIPKGKTIECTYMQDIEKASNNWGFTEYENKKGWVYCIDMFNWSKDEDTETREYFLNNGLKEIKEAVELVKQYPVEKSGDEISVISGELLSSDISGEESGEIIVQNNSTSKLTTSQIILICVVCALVASATTTVVIILINKKNK